ncbi:3-methyl-2-oxobutanoate dehydrogenase subunit VorB [Natranaerofaba carboxydovora]|uniref:3-methyl-2-oxobutanoate dehydrogenase subunit VorB n=1 Tax=Natranaerofaba carboxydovora TaxID=2742683 RepID=UPI001F1476AC|nr:3-methyl-2-oxobutanoate dehydrogenase subunit VorB [Natranaerofaba carboxydovora]UMZ73933.1 2-oxoglutarate oxidoreductase subunit KorA [Natranaerofaba carboxydovora]
MRRILIKGNEAIGEAAIQAGCEAYFGYPITPQNELTEYMSEKLPQYGGRFIQAESEVGAINMLLGAAASGARAMTSSSGPGISLKQEGISYMTGMELPALIVNVVRGGPGLGGIAPAQSDYFQATRGGGHGDYRVITLAPANIQEIIDLTSECFWLAELYRNPVMLYADAVLGQMMEPVNVKSDNLFSKYRTRDKLPKVWAASGQKNRSYVNKLTSLYLEPEELEKHNLKLNKKYDVIKKKEKRFEIINPGAKYFLVAYGIVSRICKLVVKNARERGLNIGLIRPISLWPFPDIAFENVMDNARSFLCVEMSMGQMIEDVKLAVDGRAQVFFYGRSGGVLPKPNDIMSVIEDKMLKGEMIET